MMSTKPQRPGRRRKIHIVCLNCGTHKTVHRRNMHYCSPECGVLHRRKKERKKYLAKREADPRYAIQQTRYTLKAGYKNKTTSEIVIHLFRLLTRIDVLDKILESRGVDASKEDLVEHWKNVAPHVRRRRRKKLPPMERSCPKCQTTLDTTYRSGKICKTCGFVINAEILKGVKIE